MAIAFVFPGQGSQDVGMGKALAEVYPEARAVFDEVDAALGQKLSAIMWEGPKETLTLTENAQPALMAVSMAVMRVLESKGFSLKNSVKFVAGHSLGEYSALAAAGAISLADTARLLRLRGQSMQKAVPVGQGAMAALLGVGMDVGQKVAEEAAQGDVCQVANDNEPTQVVLSGHKSAIDRVVGEIGKKHGVRRALPLPVSAPFHCALMQPAAEAMAEALAKVEIKKPVVPVVANVLATPIDDPAEIRRRLVEQVTGSVRWRESVQYMVTSGGITDVYEIGAGKVLAGLVKRIEKGLNATSLGSPAEIDAVLADLLRA
jgi:[acyl-carrier-protein] S-malonyltransferase